MPLRILGIDPGTRHTGYAVVESSNELTPLTWDSISPISTSPIEERLTLIHNQLVNVINRWQPNEVAIEEPFLGKGERRYIKSAFAIGQAQAIALIAATEAGIPVFRYSPSQIKVAVTDYGTATKHQVLLMVCSIMKLDNYPLSDDAADALALCICHTRNKQVQDTLKREITLPLWSPP